MLYPPTNVMYFYYRAQKQVRVTRSKYLYYAIINRVGGVAKDEENRVQGFQMSDLPTNS